MIKKKRTARTRLSRGVFVSLCLVATIVLVVGTGMFSQRALEQQVLSDNSGTNLSESVAEVNIAEEEQPEPLEITSDAEYGDYEKGKVLVAVDEATDMQHLDEVLATSDLVETKSVSDQDISGGFVRVDINGDVPIKQILSELKGEGFAAQPNYIYYPAEDEATSSAASVNDPSSSNQWLLESVDAYRAWEIAKCKEDAASSPKVSVAVIDTGCLVAHEDLINNIRAVYNSATSELGVDKVADSIGHGTHVAGIVAADANNGKGVAGVSYDAGLVIIKASIGDTKSFSTETLAQAYTWLMTNSGAQTNAQRNNVRVINMSVGGKGSIDSDDVLYQKITQAKNAGILTVCAAGNADAGVTPPFDCIPGDYKDCLTVINLAQGSNAQPNDSSGTLYVTRSSTSNYNVSSGELSQAKNISAPGAKIYSTYNGGTSSYGSLSGTSMASPAVAGIAALLFAYDSSLSADEAREVLEQTATDIGAEGWDRETGYGEVDAYHALQILSAAIKTEQVNVNVSVAVDLRGADDLAMDASEWQWASSNPNVLKIDANTGMLTVVGSGSATISATHKKISGKKLFKLVQVSEEAANPATVDLSTVIVDAIPNATYTGQEIKPDLIVRTADGRKLTKGEDYLLTYENNINAGSAQIMINPASSDRATGSKEVTFQIDPRDISSVKASISAQDYNGGAEVRPNVTIRDDLQNALYVDKDYILSYSNNREPGVGSASVTVIGKGNYKGRTNPISFDIIASFDDVSVGRLSNTYVYTGEPITPTPSMTWNGEQLPANGSTCIYSGNNINVTGGQVIVTVRGAGGWAKGSPQYRTFTISPKNLRDSDVTVSKSSDPTYTGSAVKPSSITVKYNGMTLREGVDYTIVSNSVNVGSASFTIKAKSTNFTGERAVGFNIKRAQLTQSNVRINGITSKTYNGAVQLQNNMSVVFGGKTLTRGTDYSVLYRDINNKSVSPKAVGTYKIVIVGKGSYAGEVESTFSIVSTSSGNSNTNSNNASSNSTSSATNTADNNANSTNAPSTVVTPGFLASLPLPSAPVVTGTWKKSYGKWWFSYSSASKAKHNKSWPANEWVSIKGKRYHFDINGNMHSNWLNSNGYWYWLGSDGAMKTGWKKANGKWYFMERNGIMKTGWLSDAGKRYFLSSSGAMLTGWRKISNKWYYFSGSGAMQKNRWIGNYYVGSDGVMATNTWIGKYHVNANGKWDATRR